MIALIGSHGTGKSTLLKALKTTLPQFYITDGVSRPVQEVGTLCGLNRKSKQAVMNHITEWIWNNSIDQSNYISTRSIIDAIVYSEAQGWFDLADKAREIFEASDYHKVKYAYIPIEFELEDDGVRFTDVEFQKDIDQRMLKFIEQYNLDITELRGSVDNRVQDFIFNLA